MVSVWDSALDDVTITERSHLCLYNDSAASFGWQMVKDANRQNMTMRFPTTCDGNSTYFILYFGVLIFVESNARALIILLHLTAFHVSVYWIQLGTYFN